jgi:hypothetical protein
MKINVPVAVAVSTAFVGVGLAVGGVFLLAGVGWALVAGSVPLIGVSAVTFRGLMRGEREQ